MAAGAALAAAALAEVAVDAVKTHKIGIVGLGLIGGSLAIALNKKYSIIGMDTNAESIDFCLKNGHINSSASVFTDFYGCAAIFVCVPVGLVKQTCDSIFAAVGDSSIITDVASVKGILSECKGRLVGGHPMAGTEFCGITAAKPNLFFGAPYYLVKYNNTTNQDYLLVKGIIESELKSNIVEISFDLHDKIVSKVSHLPHMIAYALASVAYGSSSINAGNSLKDTTRIAASDPRFWADVARLNKDNLLNDLQLYISELAQVQTMIQQENFVGLQEYFSQAQSKKLTEKK